MEHPGDFEYEFQNVKHPRDQGLYLKIRISQEFDQWFKWKI